jgi:translation initiation factor 3 subunit H
VSYKDIFEEIPIRIHNSLLSSALLYELQEAGAESDFEKLDLSTNPFLEKNLEFLVECLDDLSSEQTKFQYYQRNVQRQLVQQNQWLQKRVWSPL